MDDKKKGLWFKKTKTGKDMLVFDVGDSTVFLFKRDKTKETQPDFDIEVRAKSAPPSVARSPDPLSRGVAFQRPLQNSPEEDEDSPF